MNRVRGLGNLGLIHGAILVGVAVTCPTDDFQLELPEEIDLSNFQTQILIRLSVLLILVVMAAG